MPTNQGWYPLWFADNWIPPVWFAPGDESSVPPEELRPQGGGKAVPKKSQRPAWVIPQKFAKPRPAQPVQDTEALLLCGAL